MRCLILRLLASHSFFASNAFAECMIIGHLKGSETPHFELLSCRSAVDYTEHLDFRNSNFELEDHFSDITEIDKAVLRKARNKMAAIICQYGVTLLSGTTRVHVRKLF